MNEFGNIVPTLHKLRISESVVHAVLLLLCSRCRRFSSWTNNMKYRCLILFFGCCWCREAKNTEEKNSLKLLQMPICSFFMFLMHSKKKFYLIMNLWRFRERCPRKIAWIPHKCNNNNRENIYRREGSMSEPKDGERRGRSAFDYAASLT